MKIGQAEIIALALAAVAVYIVTQAKPKTTVNPGMGLTGPNNVTEFAEGPTTFLQGQYSMRQGA